MLGLRKLKNFILVAGDIIKNIPKNMGRMFSSLFKYWKNSNSEATILCYHYVFLCHPDRFKGWRGGVTIWKFFWDMFVLQKKEVVYLDEFDVHKKNQVVITFDDGYKNFLKYAFPILKIFKYKFELFVIGEYYINTKVSERNLVRQWLTKKDLEKVLKTSNGRLQYHTRTHYHLTEIENINTLEEEMKLPGQLKKLDASGFSWLAYPYCDWNNQVVQIAKKYYKGARAGEGGKNKNDPDYLFAARAIMVNNDTDLF
jgi:peptidoglycan/xylan/chitin deacetylase (PgdA/CDA1 family)